MSNTILNFNTKTQEFTINQTEFDKLEFRDMAKNELFNKEKSFLIVKNFIDKGVAKKIRDFYSKTKNSEIFTPSGKDGNSRIYFYQNSPYIYPKFITSLLSCCSLVKNRIYFYHDYYQIYCMMKDLNPMDYGEVGRVQDLHSWSAIYWYKNGNSFYRHIDDFGDLACFVVFTEKGKDYSDGGLSIDVNGRSIDMDDEFEYGDLVFLDQSKVFHKVVPIKTSGSQIGRMQLYVPTVPPNYMKHTLFYEGYLNKLFFTNEKLRIFEKISLWTKHIMSEKKVHYSRIKFNHHEKDII
jgi:hypothetical protein